MPIKTSNKKLFSDETIGSFLTSTSFEYSRGFPITRAKNMNRFSDSPAIFASLAILIFSNTGHSQSNFWEQTTGPTGGAVYALMVHENGDIFAGTEKGVFRSVDNGNIWTHSGLNTYVWCFAINSSDEIFAGVTGGGVYRSSDNGETWTKILEIATPVDALAVNDEGHIFAGSHISDNPGNTTLVFRSIDNGMTWEQVGTYSTGLTTQGVATLLINPDGVIFVGAWNHSVFGRGGVYHSNDNGVSWSQTGLKDISVLALTLDTQGNLFAGTTDGVFRSDDGDMWTRINGLDSVTVSSLTISPDGELFAGTWYDGIYRFSENDWIDLTSDFSIRGESITFNSEGDLFAASSGDGIFRSFDHGENWEQINTGLILTHVGTLAINKNGDIFAGTNGQGVFFSNDGGDSWTQTSLNDAVIRALAINLSGELFAGSQAYRGVLRSRNNGLSWEKVGLDSTIINTFLITSNEEIFAGTHHGMFRSPDNGETWIESGLNDAVIWSLALNSIKEIFAVVHMPYTRAIYRSNDNGQVWVETGLKDIYSRTVAINSNDDIFVGTSYDGGIFCSKDNGETWTQTGLTSSDISLTAIAFNSLGDIFAGSYRGGVHRSFDNGETWQQINEGLTNPNVAALAINPDGYVFAGTFGTSVFRSLETTTSVQSTNLIVPESITLEQNFPNPFNPETEIHFRLPRADHVSLTIYNILGNKIRTLVEEHLTAGSHRVQWNGKDQEGNLVSGGIYFYELKTESFSQIKKMAFIH